MKCPLYDACRDANVSCQNVANDNVDVKRAEQLARQTCYVKGLKG